MPPAYQRHVFVCTNRRPDEDPRGCCAAKGSEAVQKKFKELVHARGLKGKVRANSSGCLDACAFGVSVVVYPEGVWYQKVKVEDVEQIVDQHLIGGKPVERLLMPLRPVRND
jgi:(2Fe-2S) ferredoxin